MRRCCSRCPRRSPRWPAAPARCSAAPPAARRAGPDRGVQRARPDLGGAGLVPAGARPALLDAAARRARITAFLAARAASTDVFCLQEVQESELPAFLDALGGGFAGAMAHNDPDWWSNWLVPEIPWAPNGTAIVVRRRASRALAFRDIALSADGNHAALFDGVHRATGRRLRAASIHLDSDVQANRAARGALADRAAAGAGGRHRRRLR